MKNPYSKRRKTRKEKLNLKITKIITPYIKKISPVIIEKKHTKFIPESLYIAKETIERSWEREKIWKNKKPEDIQLTLERVYIADYMPIENVDVFNKGLKRLFSKKRAPFQHGNEERVDDFCKSVKSSLYGGSWSNFGYIKFKNEEISKVIDTINISATHVGSSSIILQFIISPAKVFLKEFEYLLSKEVEDENCFDFQMKNFFKFWNTRNRPSDSVKYEMVEDYLLELKWIAMQEINKYFHTTFHQLKLGIPSIEVYETNRRFCELESARKNEKNLFWNSVGMDFYKNDCSKDGYWDVFNEMGPSSKIDNALKLVYNSNIKMKARKKLGSIEGYVSVIMMDFSTKLFPMLIAREYSLSVSKSVAVHRENIYKFLKKNQPKYREMINTRYELEKEVQILRRFQNEFDNSFYNRTILDLDNVFEFESSRWGEFNEVSIIVENTKLLLGETIKHSDDLSTIIDDTVQLLEIKTNHSIRKWSFRLTAMSIVLSVIAIIIAALSLFYQLENEQRNELLKLMLPFIK